LSETFAFEPLEAVEPVPVLTPAEESVRVSQAADILATARAEADAIREAARQEGFEAGYVAGLGAANEYLAPSVQALAAAHAALGDERTRVGDDVERHAVDLAVRIADKALGASLELRPELVVDVVRGSLRRLLERDRVIVLVHPDDLEILRAATAELKGSLGGIGELDVQAERRVARGGAIVRTATGEVDGRLDTQLERARGAMLAALREDVS
jgi:flagellar biosynthesis/type III secretory pathway protein FliH